MCAVARLGPVPRQMGAALTAVDVETKGDEGLGQA